MEVNDIFTQLGNFWDRISVPILFHIIFFFLFLFVFGKFSIKTSLENYIQSKSFNRTKAILTEFELWKKLPLILLVLALIYLTLFNSITGLTDSIRVFPFRVSYSNTDFLQEYEPKDYIIEIAAYGKDSVPELYQVDQLKEKLLEEYKGKYPDRYDTWVKWANDQFVPRIRNFNLTALTVIALFIVLMVRFFKKNRPGKVGSFFKFLIVLIIAFPILFFLRYRAEQSIEERFSNEIIFVKSSLETDPDRKISFDSTQLVSLDKRIRNELKERKFFEPQLWVSRIVGQSDMLQKILGQRKLRNIVSRNDDYFE